MNVRRLVVGSQLLERQTLASLGPETYTKSDLRADSQILDIGAYVVRVADRTRERIIWIRVQMKQRIGPTFGKASKNVKQPWQHFAGLIAAVRQNDKFPRIANLTLCSEAVIWGAKNVQLNTVRNVLTAYTAVFRHPLSVVAHRHREVGGFQRLDPATRKTVAADISFNWEIQQPRAVNQFHLAPDIGRAEICQPPHVRQCDHNVGPYPNQQRQQGITAHGIRSDTIDTTSFPLPPPLRRGTVLPTEDVHVKAPQRETATHEPGNITKS